MKINLRKKFIIAISLLMVVVFAAAAFLFIQEKKTELADDIYFNSLAYSKLTARDVAEDYDLFLAEGGFVYFTREVRSLLEENHDVSGLKVISYEGELLYDSSLDLTQRFEGDRKVSMEIFSLIQSENVALKVKDNGDVFIKNNSFVDINEKVIDDLESGALFDFIVVPANEKYSVLYEIDYTSLDERVAEMMRRIIYLAVFGIMLGMVMSFFLSKRITKPIAKLVLGAESVAKGDLKTRVDIQTTDEIGYLGETFNAMTKDLEASMEAKLYKERVTHELELAAEIQKQIIPDKNNLPEIAGIEIAADLISAAEIGGDMYDFLKVQDDKLMFYLGDVTGHGVPAGIVSSISSALFYGYSSFDDLKKIIVNVNRVLKAKTMSNMFMTLCLMEWCAKENKFTYVNAGHEQIIHFKAGDGSVTLTPTGGVALGMLPDIEKNVKVESVDLAEGDFLVVYSDGIPEAFRNEKETYGMIRFQEVVKKYGKTAQSAEELKQKILSEVKAFTGGFEQKDDITLIVIKRS